MSCRGSARLVAPAGVGALMLALAATQGAAQAPVAPSGMRTTLDEDSDLAARLRAPSQTRRTRAADTQPIGQVPSFGTMAGRGAGKTGFLSTKPKSKSKRRSTAAKTGSSQKLPLISSPSGASATSERSVVPAEAPAASDKGSPAATQARATAKPASPPKPPALTAREQFKEQLNTLPNTVVAVPRRSPEEDPYAPLGFRTGAFVLRPAIETIAGYDSNPGRTSGGKGSAFVTVAPELSLRSDWQRHELIADIRGSYTAFEALHELDRPTLEAKAAGRIDVTDRTRAVIEGRYLLAAASPGRSDLPADLATLPITTTAGVSGGGVHRFNRLELALKGSFDRIEWEDSKLTDGTILSNKDRDYNQYGLEGRASYEVLPGVKPFVNVAADTRQHDLPVDSFGLQRDSDGIAAKAGSSFEITRTLTGEAAIGYVTRTYKDPALPELRGVLFDASLLWVASGLTNVKLNVTTTPQETTLFGISGLLSYDTSLQVDHAFRRWLIGSAKLSYGLDDFVGSSRQDQRYAAAAGLTYKLTRTVQVKGEVRHEWRRSNQPGNDYDATVGLIGLRWQP